MAYVCEDDLLNYFKLQLLSQCFVDTQENQSQDNNETSTESNNENMFPWRWNLVQRSPKSSNNDRNCVFHLS